MPLNQGQVLNNRYRVVALLGQGGFGAVYRAWDLNLKGPVALKENFNTSPEAVRQFEREARFLANMRHENLPYVIDHFTLPDQGQYMVMEFIEGQDLQSMLESKPSGLPEAQVLPWFLQVCDALSFLHSQIPPLIHRDIKPANIKVTSAGKAVLVDFGIAKAYKPGLKTTLGARAVTQGFSPPEQYGGGVTDVRSDVYAVGASLYAVLTGQTPADSLQRQLGQALPSPRQFNPAISSRVEQAIMRSMELETNRRFQSVKDFKNAMVSSAPPLPVQQETIRQPAPTYVASPQQKARAAAYTPTAVVEVQPDWEPPAYQAPVQSKPAGRGWLTAVGILAFCMIGVLLGLAGMYFTGYLPLDEWINPITPTRTLTSPPSSTPIPSSTTFLEPSRPPSLTPVPSLTFLPSSPTFTFTPSPHPSDTPLAKVTWYPCSGIYPSRLHVGDTAYVAYDPPLPNRVRSEPNGTSTIVGLLQPGEKMEILEGPICSGGWIWWRIKSLSSGLVGWTAEGDSAAYWLVPMP